MEKKIYDLAKEKGIQNKLHFDEITSVYNGIVFLYCSWSPTMGRYAILLNSLKEYKEIPVYIFDIDSQAFAQFSKERNVKSNGYGEMFWYKNNNIVAEKLKGVDSIEEFMKYNQLIVR